jgi:hypothetical protein
MMKTSFLISILMASIMNGMDEKEMREQYYAQLRSAWQKVEMRLENTEEPYSLDKPKIVKLVFINHTNEPVWLFGGSLFDHIDIEVVDERSRRLPETEWVKEKKGKPREGSAPAPKVPPNDKLEMRIDLNRFAVFKSAGVFQVTIKARPKTFGEHMKNSPCSTTIKVEENKDAHQ